MIRGIDVARLREVGNELEGRLREAAIVKYRLEGALELARALLEEAQAEDGEPNDDGAGDEA